MTVNVAVSCYDRSRATVVSIVPLVTFRVRRFNKTESVVDDQAKLAGSSLKGWEIAALPSVGVALLPKLTCPVCWPAYTALLSSAGIGFVDYTPFLLPTVAVFLGVTLWALAFRASARRGYGPFWLGVLGALGVLVGKFIFETEIGLYLSAGLLVGASLWNIWPSRSSTPVLTKSLKQGVQYGYQKTD